MTINELREKRNSVWEKAKAFLASHRNESGVLSAEDTATYEAMEKEVVDLGTAIKQLERQEAMERNERCHFHSHHYQARCWCQG